MVNVLHLGFSLRSAPRGIEKVSQTSRMVTALRALRKHVGEFCTARLAIGEAGGPHSRVG